MTKCGKYIKVKQNLLQKVASIRKCDKELLQSVTYITV